MLKRFHVQGFKSLRDVTFEPARLSVLFGPNGSGKSNILDALRLFSKLVTVRDPAEAFGEDFRGVPFEQFTMPPGGIAELKKSDEIKLRIEAVNSADPGPAGWDDKADVEYIFEVAMNTRTAELERRVIKPVPKNQEERELVRDMTSNLMIRNWKTYFLSPDDLRFGRRTPMDTEDIGPTGGKLLPYLNIVANKNPGLFESIKTNMRLLIPGIENMEIRLDDRGELDLILTQEGTPYSFPLLSDGTLRFLGLLAIAASSQNSESLIGIEEPENGAHPRRLEHICDVLHTMAFRQGRQIIVTTHSPKLVTIMNRMAADNDGIGLYSCRIKAGDTKLDRICPITSEDVDKDSIEAIRQNDEDRLFEFMLLNGWLDG